MAGGGFQCCTLHQALHPATRFPIFHPRQLPPPHPLAPLIARLAILDALRCPRERDSCREIELNLEMNIESNELSTSQPASQPATTPESPSQPSPPCRRAETVSPRFDPSAFLPSSIGTIDLFRVIYLFAFRPEIIIEIADNRWK